MDIEGRSDMLITSGSQRVNEQSVNGWMLKGEVTC